VPFPLGGVALAVIEAAGPGGLGLRAAGLFRPTPIPLLEFTARLKDNNKLDLGHRKEKYIMTKLLSALAAGLFLVASSALPGAAAEKLKVGVLATLEGTYTVLGEDGVRGFKVALKQFGGKAGGRDIVVTIGASDASPDSAIRAARKLVEQDGVDILIGPLSGSEGIAVKDYAKSQPQVTFINGISGAQETTFVDPAPNFFRFNMDGAQWSSGIAEYIYNVKKWRNIATIGEDYSFIYTQVFGLAVEFCSLGGKISERFWVPLGTKDFASIIAALPDDVDAIYLGLGGGDAVNFLNQYQQAGGDANLIGGTIMVDQTVLSSKGKAKQALIGTPASGPQADSWDNAKWQAYVKAYQDAFPPDKRFPSPSLLATGYYNAATAAFTVLNSIGGDLSDGHKKFRAGLTTLELDAPNGKIKLDGNRQAIGTNFVTEVVEENGILVNKLVKIVPNVNQTLGLDPAKFAKIGLPGRDIPVCKKY
jgi:ABC-type branched-subunit amino acid transport system substrate-binding protein